MGKIRYNSAMKYRFLLQRETFTPIQPNRDYDIVSPTKAKWQRDWEWSYDFPEIFANISFSLAYWLFKLSLRLVSFVGGRVSNPISEYTTQVQYVNVDTDRIRDAILSKLHEREKSRLSNQPTMIVIGAREFHELNSLDHELSMMIEFPYAQRKREGYRESVDYYILGIPVFVVPDFVGIAILPDMTKQAVKRLDYSRGL